MQRRTGGGGKSGRAAAQRTRPTAPPPPIVPLMTSALQASLSKSTTDLSGANLSKDNGKKAAWAVLDDQAPKGKLVSSDGSIMPKPGEIPVSRNGTAPPGRNEAQLRDQTTASHVKMVPETAREWDGRERGRSSGQPKSFAVPKSSIDAALAAAAASKSAMPVAIKSSFQKSSEGGDKGLDADLKASAMKIVEGKSLVATVGNSSVVLSTSSNVDTTLGLTTIKPPGSSVSSASSKGLLLSQAAKQLKDGPSPQDTLTTSSSRAASVAAKSKDQEPIPSFGRQGRLGGEPLFGMSSSRNQIAAPSSTTTGTISTGNGSRSGSDSTQWRSSSTSSSSLSSNRINKGATSSGSNNNSSSSSNRRSPFLAQNASNISSVSTGAGGGINQTSRNSNTNNSINVLSSKDRAYMGSQTALNADLEQFESLRKELEREREQRRTLNREVSELKKTNNDLQAKLTSQEKELSMLRRQIHGMLMSSTSIANGNTAGHYEGSAQAQHEDSPLLRQLYGTSQGLTVAPVQSSMPSTHNKTVSGLVDELLSEVVGSSLSQRLWSEASPANETLISGIEYHDSMPRPQEQFEDSIDNSELPFFPKLRRKYNFIEPLNHKQLMNSPWISPYCTEIMNVRYSPWQLGKPETIREIKGLNSCNLFYVSQLDQLEDLVYQLQNPDVREIAIDTEHHSQRSYHGFLCLMQISTRTADYIIDVLSLRSKLQILAPVFTNPQVVKVLHGADMDIIWLQRDLGLYIVNMFDTGQAARELMYPSFSYSYLLNRFVGLQADKAHQTSDWRIRPLPRQMIDYARQDTHYLLDIYDRIRCELLDKHHSLVEKVLHRSAKIATSVYVKDQIKKDAICGLMLQLSRKHRVRLQCAAQREVFIALAYWRDRVARIRDESVQYVMEDHILLALARDCPSSLKALQRTFRRLNTSISPLIFALQGSLFWEIASVLDPPVPPARTRNNGLPHSVSDPDSTQASRHVDRHPVHHHQQQTQQFTSSNNPQLSFGWFGTSPAAST